MGDPVKNLFSVLCAALFGLGVVLAIVPAAHAENGRDKQARIVDQQRAAKKEAADKKEAERKAAAGTAAPARK